MIWWILLAVVVAGAVFALRGRAAAPILAGSRVSQRTMRIRDRASWLAGVTGLLRTSS